MDRGLSRRSGPAGRARPDPPAEPAGRPLRQNGPGSGRTTAWWAGVGQVALSLGCVGAAAAGQVQFGVPCVVGGALSSAALRYLGSAS